jgi:hypothetical protein
MNFRNFFFMRISGFCHYSRYLEYLIPNI